jgi:hypothetical protein
MQETRKLDLGKLMGFETIRDQDRVDFQDETFGAKLGAKVSGTESNCPPNN